MARMLARDASATARTAFALLALACLWLPSHPAAAGLADLESAVIQLYRAQAEAIVSVHVEIPRADSEREGPTRTLLTGFLIDEAGHVVTNAVPIEGAKRIWVEHASVSYAATPVGSDDRSNVGLLRLDSPPEGIRYVDIYSGYVPPEIGALAFGITNPPQLGPTPSWGIVTGFESAFGDVTFPFVQTRTNIRIGPAEGGSPVFNRHGELLGLCVATLPDLRSSYLVPSKALRRILADLKENGRVRYGSLPLSFEQWRSTDSADPRLAVKSVEAGGAAAKAGIRAGDVLLQIDGLPIHSLNELRDLLFYSPLGAFIDLRLERQGAELDFALLFEEADAAAE